MNPIRWDLGDGIVVRTLAPDEDEILFALVDRNRERLHRWMPWEPMTRKPSDTRNFIERALASETDREANGIWIDGRLVGMIGMRVDVADGKGEFGYWIDAEVEGRGVVTRASERMLAFAFDELGLHRVELQAASTNTRSLAVADRLGMTREGISRESQRDPEGHHDMVRFGLLADEWRRARAGGTGDARV
jgi:ribosomal-protein-serine acetyltransferase